MKADVTYTYIISVVATLITMSVAYFRFSKKGVKECGHLFEFLASLLFSTTVSFLAWDQRDFIVGMSMLSWLWPLRTLLLISQDLTRMSLLQKDHYVALSIGVIFSAILFAFNYEQVIFTAPFAVSVGLVGFSFFFQSVFKNRKKQISPLIHLYFGLMLAFIVSRASFPLWLGYAGTYEYGVLFDCFLLMLFNVSLLPLYLETFTISSLENALTVRNQQLFNRSGFSEFKILSAGIAHEINNALTVINAKTEQLMRTYHEAQDQKNFRLVLSNTDRIGKSIKGLREFIYPQKATTSEVMFIKDLLNNVLMLYGQRIRNHGAFVTIHGNSEKKVKGYRIQLEQVILSLINNSLETIDHLNDKWIEITFEPYDETIAVIFKDSSKGLDDERADTILDPSLTVKSAEDNNLGLILAKDIIEKHHGTLSYVKGKSNRTFRIELPVAVSDEDAMNMNDESDSSTPLNLH